VEPEQVRAELHAAMAEAGAGLPAADRLCVACVERFDVDGAAISLMCEGTSQGTFGSSGPLGRLLDEYQFTFGEGPCVDAFAAGRPVLVPDIGHAHEHRWPVFSAAAVGEGIHAVFALPAVIAGVQLGVLDLFRSRPGPLSPDDLAASLLAAELAAMPLLDLSAGVVWAPRDDVAAGTAGLDSLERVEVYQATGMIMGQLDVGPTDALLRLRAHAFATGRTASEVAWAIVDRRLRLERDDGPADPPAGSAS
jgi:hypothetical protein